MDANNNFMSVFKYYKSNKPKPSLEHVLSFENGNNTSDQVSNYTISLTNLDKETEFFGLQKSSQWNIFTFFKHPGLIFIRNPFTSIGQRYWIRKCLQVYTKKPNKSNLDIEMSLDDWWSECFKNGKYDERLIKKMRWTTLGYHHNWDTKVYSEDNKTTFPEELGAMCDIIAKVLGFEEFKAEAAIVNYYHMGSTLSAHTDHSEVNLEAPLFSFSFGQSAIFLLGGHDKSVEPSAILLNSGDIVVMSKEARLCYHAVPRILPSLKKPWNYHDFSMDPSQLNGRNNIIQDMYCYKDDESWHRCCKYVEESRININVRQVLRKNQKNLNDI